MSQPVNRTSPIVAIAAVSVIIFSAVGVGVMTGLIPSSFSKNEPAAAESASAQTEPAAAPAPAPAPVSATASTTPPTAPAKPEAPQAVAAPQPRPAEPVRPAASASAPRVAAVKICAECGTVRAVNLVENPGEGSGLGAIAGGVVGGILGNQIGDGSGRRIATVAGAAGGAYAGHQIEKRVKTTRYWNVVVRMEDGTTRNFPFDTEPAFRPGDKVRVDQGALVAR